MPRSYLTACCPEYSGWQPSNSKFINTLLVLSSCNTVFEYIFTYIGDSQFTVLFSTIREIYDKLVSHGTLLADFGKSAPFHMWQLPKFTLQSKSIYRLLYDCTWHGRDRYFHSRLNQCELCIDITLKFDENSVPAIAAANPTKIERSARYDESFDQNEYLID